MTRTFVLDSSVLLSDPRAIHRFDEHDVVVPVAVIDDLSDAADDGIDSARIALWEFDRLREHHGHLADPVPVGEHGGSVRLVPRLDSTLTATANQQLIAIALHLAREGADVCIITKSVPLRVTAAAHGLVAEEYLAEQVEPSGWTGMTRLEIDEEQMAALWTTGLLSPATLNPENISGPLYLHEGFVLSSPRGTALGRLHPDGEIHLVQGDQNLFGLRGLSTDQRLAIDILLDEDIGIVSLDGPPGSGKSALALSAALESVMERRMHRRIMVFRQPISLDDQSSEQLESLVYDTLGALVSQHVLEDLIERNILEVFPLSQIRGRALHDSFVIVDDAQALDQKTLAKVLSRTGQNTRIVFTHDSTQRLSLKVSPRDGIAVLIERLKGHSQFAHITLTHSELSPVSELGRTIFGD